jgi:hypothetical protein
MAAPSAAAVLVSSATHAIRHVRVLTAPCRGPTVMPWNVTARECGKSIS